MSATRGHVTATRREFPAGGRNVRVMIRLACSVCEGTGLAGSPTEERALDFAEEIDWHGTCRQARSLAMVTGSVAATVRVERRDPATGELVVESEATFTR